MNRRHFLLALTGGTVSTAFIDPVPTYGWQAQQPASSITDNADFYVQRYHHVPEVTDWSLTVRGIIGQSERVLTVDNLRFLRSVERMQTLACIGNPVGGSAIGNAVWKGFMMRDILRGITPLPGSSHIKLSAADGYETALTVEQFADAMLVYEMNGEPLPAEHGAPFRLIVPGVYAAKMPKWITRIEFIDYEFKGFWASRGWSSRMDVQTHSAITFPYHRATINGGTRLEGFAFGGEITSIEVRVDGGVWMPADFIQPESTNVWTRWMLDWTPAAPGQYLLEVRATNAAGFTQFEENNDLTTKPNGTSAIHKILVNVR
jgi:DMSO/TMAO reductase YedYZ molybdopterin-dependent catalytic subunit